MASFEVDTHRWMRREWKCRICHEEGQSPRWPYSDEGYSWQSKSHKKFADKNFRTKRFDDVRRYSYRVMMLVNELSVHYYALLKRWYVGDKTARKPEWQHILSGKKRHWHDGEGCGVRQACYNSENFSTSQRNSREFKMDFQFNRLLILLVLLFTIPSYPHVKSAIHCQIHNELDRFFYPSSWL